MSKVGKGDLSRYSPEAIFRVIVNLPKYLRLYWRLLRDRRVPSYLKGVFILALAYVVSPVDLIPDFTVPFLGQLDDLVVAVFALRFFLTMSPREVVAEHMRSIGFGPGDAAA